MKRPILLTIASISAAIAAALATIALVLVASGSNTALAASSLNNGNFETGDLSGWTEDTTKSSGEAGAVTSYCPSLHVYIYGTCNEQSGFFDEVLPKEGSYFALLQPSGVFTEGVFEDAIISQSFKASNGDRVSGWAFFLAEDWSGEGCYAGFPICGWNNVTGKVVITSDSGTTVATPFQQSYSRYTWGGDSGWVYWEHTFTDLTGEGSFQLEARTRDSYVIDSSIGLDGVKTSTASPPPSDTQAPSPPTITSPQTNTYDTDGSFSVSGSAEAASTVEVFEGTTSKGTTKADSSSGAWSVALSGVSEGAHTYSAKAKDAAGNTSSASVSVTVTVDKTAPTVGIVTPSNSATGVSRTTSVTASFSEAMDPATLSASSFRLTKQGSTTAITAAVSYDATAKKVTLKPSSTLAASTTFTATVKGGASGAKDKAGNALGSDKVWSFTTKK
jgi:hypothetical protein